MKAKSILGLAIFILLVAVSGALAQDVDGDGVCPLSQGYWANHPESWTVNSLMLGTQFYDQAEITGSFLPGGGGDASTILAVQLVAAKLNIAAGSDPTPITSILLQADALLAAYQGKLPYNVATSSSQGQLMISLAAILDSYNNGLLTLGCALTPAPTLLPSVTPSPTGTVTAVQPLTPTPTTTEIPVTIIIEGPVQTINVNIITIYDIDIQIDINDPILTQIQIGDFVHVEGNVVSGTTAIIVIAVAVYIVDDDVIVGNDNVIIWEDNNGNCNNPPPPWATANGWRRRCQNQPHPGNNGMGNNGNNGAGNNGNNGNGNNGNGNNGNNGNGNNGNGNNGNGNNH